MPGHAPNECPYCHKVGVILSLHTLSCPAVHGPPEHESHNCINCDSDCDCGNKVICEQCSSCCEKRGKNG